jgi:hypothetical protein
VLAVEVVKEVRGRGVELSDADDRLRFRPAGSLPPELKTELKEHKDEILEILANEHPLECLCLRCSTRAPSYAKIKTTGEVFELAREMFGRIEDPVTPPAPPGRDPMAKRGTDKARFFSDDWWEAEPQNFRAYRSGGVA